MRKATLGLLVVMMLAVACSPAVQTATEQEPVGEGAAATGEFSCDPTGNEPEQFSGPEQVIRPGHDYVATITMENGGEIVIDLFPEAAPITVNNFVFLACQGFYDGVTFHRVIPGFVAQGGDPTGTGTGGPGYTIQDEHSNGLVFDRPGLVSMAHTAAPNSAGSQFFITYAPVAHLNGTFTIFGEVVEGMDVAEAITPRDPQSSPSLPPGDVIRQIRVEER